MRERAPDQPLAVKGVGPVVHGERTSRMSGEQLEQAIDVRLPGLAREVAKAPAL